MPRIAEEKIEEIRSASNIVHYIGQFVNLKKAGRNFKGLCPFHSEKTPSFMVSPEKQIYHCFGCGKGGNIFSFIMDYEKLPFSEALARAADFCGIELPAPDRETHEKADFFQQLYGINDRCCTFFQNMLGLPRNKIHMDYFLNRGLSPETVSRFRLGYAPDSFDQLLNYLKKEGLSLEHAVRLGLIQKRDRGEGYYDKFRHRIIFPFINITGKIVGFGGRKLTEEQQPKYLNSPESPVYKKGELLYGLHQAIRPVREADFVILVEGYFDLLRLVESGIRNSVASSGTALTESQAKLIRRYTRNVYVAYDGDDAGIKAAIRVAHVLENQDLNAFIIPLPQGEDPDSMIQSEGGAAFEKLISKRLSPVEFELNRFFSHHPSPTAEDKERLIRDMFQILIDQPNRIKTGLILHQLSDRLEISESLLIDQYNRLKRYPKRNVSNSSNTKEPAVEVPIQKGAFKAEQALISLLLSDDAAVRSFVLEHVSAEIFENEELRELFNIILNEIEETGHVGLSDLLSDESMDARIRSRISELVLRDELQSLKFAEDCVIQVKKWHLEKKSKELSSRIKAESNSVDSVMHYSRELSRIRKEIAELAHEVRSIKDKSL